MITAPIIDMTPTTCVKHRALPQPEPELVAVLWFRGGKCAGVHKPVAALPALVMYPSGGEAEVFLR